MLSEALVRTFNQLLNVELGKLNEQTQAAIMGQVSAANARGALQSSTACLLVVREAASSIPTRAQVSLNLLMRCMSAHGMQVTAETREPILTLLSQNLREQQRQLKNMASGAAPFRSGLVGNHMAQMLATIDRNVDAELQRLAGEVDLMIASTETRQRALATKTPTPEAGPSNYIFQGPVNVVQTGAGTIGVATQHIDQGAKDALERALARVVDELAKPSDDPLPFDAGEVTEMVAESRAELLKDKPNAGKLRALVSGIAGAISFAPRLRDAYETVKWGASFLNINLP